MLRDLTIRNYRAFKDFSIDGLARVNLIVGDNNSGKTSFLEAVYLLVNQGRPTALLELLEYRGEFVEPSRSHGAVDYQLAYVFRTPPERPGRDTADTKICITSQHDQNLSIQIQPRSRQSSMGAAQPGLQLDFAYGGCNEDAGQALNIDENYFFVANNHFDLRHQAPSAFHFVPTNSADLSYLATLWDTVALIPSKETRVVQALRLLADQVEDIRFVSQQTAGRVLIKLHGRDERFPLSSLGDGMRRMLTLSMSAVMAERGVLLVDEIDTGLYHRTQVGMWKLLIETAQRLNVQIFATTHSWDCVAAFQEALRESSAPEEGKLFRLEERNGDIRAIEYSSEDLTVAVDHAIEVR